MTRELHVRTVRRKEIDEDKLALAFLMLAKILREQDQINESQADSSRDEGRQEAA